MAGRCRWWRGRLPGPPPMMATMSHDSFTCFCGTPTWMFRAMARFQYTCGSTRPSRCGAPALRATERRLQRRALVQVVSLTIQRSKPLAMAASSRRRPTYDGSVALGRRGAWGRPSAAGSSMTLTRLGPRPAARVPALRRAAARPCTFTALAVRVENTHAHWGGRDGQPRRVEDLSRFVYHLLPPWRTGRAGSCRCGAGRVEGDLLRIYCGTGGSPGGPGAGLRIQRGDAALAAARHRLVGAHHDALEALPRGEGLAGPPPSGWWSSWAWR